MKYNNAEALESKVTDGNDEEQLDAGNAEMKVQLICRSCEKPMASLKETAVQCEILKDVNKNGYLTVNDARRGSIQSVTEVREDVGFDDNVSGVEEGAEPNEIVLVTRSFENEGQPIPPRRSSISQFLSNIKTLGTRPKSDSNNKKRFLEESDADPDQSLRSGIRRGSVGLSQGSSLSPMEITLEEPDNNGMQGPQMKRKSVQLSNGQIVQEETGEYTAESAIQMDDDAAPGEINFVSRSFETVQEYQPRRESLIDKLNFVKILGKNRKRKDGPASSKEEDEDENITKYATSGVRRKSIAPAALVDIGEVTVYDESDQEEGATAADIHSSKLADLQAARYVTNGIRRGSVAAVSAAPPCITQEPMQRHTGRAMLHPDRDDEQSMRYVTSGIRRDSVAAVSAAPPCRSPADHPDMDMNKQNNDSENIGTDTDDQDNLRSGVRRRSLIPAADGSLITSPTSSPLLPREPDYNPVANLTIYSSGEESDNNDNETEDQEVEQEQQRSPIEDSNEKGIHGLFESLTGRETGVDYRKEDAEAIEKNREQESKQNFFSNPIPQITLSMDAITADNDNGDVHSSAGDHDKEDDGHTERNM